MQVLQATCTIPVVGDMVLEAEKTKDDGSPSDDSQPQTANMLLWSDMKKNFAVSSLILPEFVPDSQISLRLQGDSLENLVNRLCELAKTFTTLKFPEVLQVAFIVKLLYLQQT